MSARRKYSHKLSVLRGKDLLPCLGIEDGFIIFKVMSLRVKRNNGGKLEIKCVMLTMKTIISQEKFKKNCKNGQGQYGDGKKEVLF